MQAETVIYFGVWWVLFEYSSFDHFPCASFKSDLLRLTGIHFVFFLKLCLTYLTSQWESVVLCDFNVGQPRLLTYKSLVAWDTLNFLP